MKESYTRYERARIIGARALQISMGAPVLITTGNIVACLFSCDSDIDPLEIAIEEFQKRVVPITVKRVK